MTRIEERRLPPGRPLEALYETAWRLSRQILEITTEAGSGHPSSSLSSIDLLTTLYFGGVMRYDPERPNWPERDRFILSKGHAAPALYTVLAEGGYFNPELIRTLREIGSSLEGHPHVLALPGVEASTGSMGQGLSIGLGHALAARVDGLDYWVYVLIGDGESDEEQILEAARGATKYNVRNLTAILDYNKSQQTGPVSEARLSLDPMVEKWDSFGWEVHEIDGHDIEQVLRTLQDARWKAKRPQMIVAHTLKGRGLSPFEQDDVNGKQDEPLNKEELEIALAELGEQRAVDMADTLEELELTAEDVHGKV